MKTEREALVAELVEAGHLKDDRLRDAVMSVPREGFLKPGVFIQEPGSYLWSPITPDAVPFAEWARLAYRNESLVTQLDGSVTADAVGGPVEGDPTSSSTLPSLVVGMIEELGAENGHNVLEIGTGTGYSTALMCSVLGMDNVTTIEVDPEVAKRADDALEAAGFSTWTLTGDGLLGHPYRAPYDRVIATCAVRRIPMAWVRQTRPGGVILATVGAWHHGTGLAKVRVKNDGTAEGRIVGQSSFMQARAEVYRPLNGDLNARAFYADSERAAAFTPDELQKWMPAFLAQLAAPNTQLVRAADSRGNAVFIFDVRRESFAELRPNEDGTWTVRQGGPRQIWNLIENAVTAWREVGSPDITAVQVRLTPDRHEYWIEGDSRLRWEHVL
ncbi:ATP-grasp peptide maturase system methyltransferase [Catenulispora pinistramenti]|uniref:ATP-grasp peptide maturase system methyltransferase n=1 Tax=Catenulispora pinistramenti TaxID=2705254 RepID=UPI0022A759E0